MDEATIVDDRRVDGPALAPRRIGRYLLLEELGRGGMGAVFGAYDPELDRRVAIKVLAGDDGDERRRARLLREAQALARLAHPNVVAVHDVGLLNGQVYVAMEYIQGDSLRGCLAAPRRWPEIVDLFIQAGRGLAAAHAAGLIHRDFKPDNVMVSGDGRVRVVDFGLAALAGAGAPPAPHASQPSPRDASALSEARTELSGDVGEVSLGRSSLLSSRLTVAGARMGTLAYMSPEQFAAGEVGPASDQFSFAVALYEALYGQRPFGGETATEYAIAVASGAVRPPPRGSDVPRWLMRTLQRALAVDPRDRFADMRALLGELTRDRGRWRRRLLAGAGVALLVGAAAVAARSEPAPLEELCVGAGAHWEGVWDAERREAVTAAFTATGLAYARESVERVTGRLDEHAQRWTEAHTSTCQAHQRGELSDALFDRQMACLKGQLGGVAAHIEVLARADASAVERAVEAVDDLPAASECADPRRLFPERLVPVDPEVAAAVAVQRDRMAAADAERAAGHFDVAARLFAEVESAARELGDVPLLIEVQYLFGFVQFYRGSFAEARTRWLEGYWSAVQVEHREYELDLALALFQLASGENVDPREGVLWRGTSRALVVRQHAERSHEQVKLLLEMAELALLEESRGEASELALAAVALSTELFGPDALRTAHAHAAAGRILRSTGKLDDALREYLAARPILLAQLGPMHPTVAATANNLAAVYSSVGRLAEAELEYLAARRLIERALGPDATALGFVQANLVELYSSMGRYAEAEAAGREALARIERAFGPEHPRTALALNNLGSALQLLNRDTEATPHFTRSVAIFEKTLGVDHFQVAYPLHGLAQAHLSTGHPEIAEPLFRRTLALTEKALGPDDPENAHEHLGIGLSLVARGRPREAIAPLERALVLWGDAPAARARVGEVHFGLARALWAIGTDRVRARREAELALPLLRDAPAKIHTRPEQVEAWLAAHRRGR